MQNRGYSALAVSLALSLGTVAIADSVPPGQEFALSSSEFKSGGTLPISAIYNYPEAGTNACSINGATGGDMSPALMWDHAPPHTVSFVVTLFDTTAGVMHWGMYNIAAETTSLPKNAGAANSNYGTQAVNVFSDESYDGPCPPADYPPNNHRYVFTVYALSQYIDLYPTPDFPASGLQLYRTLLIQQSEGHVLGAATLTSYYSTTP